MGAQHHRSLPTLDLHSLGDELLRDLATAPVRDVMNRRALVLHSDASAEAAAQLLVERSVGGAPVIDDEGRLVGFVVTADLLRLRDDLGASRGSEDSGRGSACTRDGRPVRLGRGFHVIAALNATTVEAAMTPFVYSVRENAPMGNAIGLMAFESLHRLPVVDGERCVVGVLSSLDVVRWLERRLHVPGAEELVRKMRHSAAAEGSAA